MILRNLNAEIQVLVIIVFQDVLNMIAEKGPHFTGIEYAQLIQLYHRSHPGNPIVTQEARMQRLIEIMEKGQNETV